MNTAFFSLVQNINIMNRDMQWEILTLKRVLVINRSKFFVLQSFEEYLHRVGIILAQKMSAINHLQNEIGQYQARFNPSCTSDSVAAAAAASSIVTTNNISQHS